MILDAPEGEGKVTLWMASRPEEVAALAKRCAEAEVIALDVEADGLFAFRPKLCTLQLAFREPSGLVVGVVDTLATEVGPLAQALGEGGPVKVLHDLTFDARMLEVAGAPLGRARDTSVAARLLGYKEGGLAALLRIELGVSVDKKHQQHDWSRRPLGEEHIRYLADDVRYLLPLSERLAEKAAAVGIEDEIAEECAYKLASARRPPRDLRPAYARVKGALALDKAGRAALRHLVDVRDEAAAAADVPPFKVVSNEVLLELAKRRPMNAGGVRSIAGSLRRVEGGGDLVDALRKAIAEGAREGDVPPDHQEFFEVKRLDKEAVGRRKDLEGRVTRWRRQEAKRRGVDEQAVLPGHCVQDLASMLSALDAGADGAAVREVLGRVPGCGAKRLERYGDELAAIFQQGAGTGTGAGTDTGAGTGAGTDTDTDTGAGTDTDTGAGTKPPLPLGRGGRG